MRWGSKTASSCERFLDRLHDLGADLIVAEIELLGQFALPNEEDGETFLVLERARKLRVQIVHRANGEDEGRIVAIIALYKKKFAQEAVFRVRSDVWMPR